MTFDEAKAIVIARVEAEGLSLRHIPPSEIDNAARKVMFAQHNGVAPEKWLHPTRIE